jgi:hypothetical protein
MVLVASATVSGLTPDLKSVELAEACAEEYGKEAGEALLTDLVSRESQLIMSAHTIAIGRVLDETEHWTVTGDGRRVYPRRFRVSVRVERYLAGGCGDTLRFWQNHVNPSVDFAPDFPRSTYDVEYAPGDSVVVLLYAECEADRYAESAGRSYRYVISGGMVESKGIPVEQLVREIAVVRQCEDSGAAGASPN